MKKIYLFASALFALLIFACSEEQAELQVQTTALESGTITGGPFTFCVDGTADFVTEVSLDATNAEGTNSSWVITDEDGKILGLPPTLEDVGKVDFDGAGEGICLIWYLRYEDDLVGLAVDGNTNELEGTFDLSNSIQVTRQETKAGTLAGGPYEFTVDGKADFVTDISLDSENAKGTNSTFVITDDKLNILGLPPTLEDVKKVDFDMAGAGVCLIWHLRFEDGLVGAEAGANTGELEGCFSLSNSIQVTRLNAANAGVISGGPYNFCVDGEADFVKNITVDNTNASGSESGWVITDDKGLILGLPPTLDAVKGVNFDEAGAGTCLIWYIRYEEGVTGLEAGSNTNDLQGNFSLSNAITVTRTKTEAGTLTGGPYTFYVDGDADFVTDITLDSSAAAGTNSMWVITDDKLNILGLPPTLEAVKNVNFDGAGAGTCLIWYLRYEDGLEGAEMGNNTADLKGCFDLSNAVEVTRIAGVNAGEIAGGPFSFCVDGTADNVSGITVDGTSASGANSTWVITDPNGNILGLPPTLEDVQNVNFDAAGPGVCLIWYARYEGDVEGNEVGKNTNDITGNFDLSNPLTVTRTKAEAGTLSGGPFEFTVDGTADHVSGISLDASNASGANSSWIITDESGKILGLPPTLADVEGVNFDAAGAGTCFIYHIRYEDGLTGLSTGWTFDELSGCYDISNAIKVVRK